MSIAPNNKHINDFNEIMISLGNYIPNEVKYSYFQFAMACFIEFQKNGHVIYDIMEQKDLTAEKPYDQNNVNIEEKSEEDESSEEDSVDFLSGEESDTESCEDEKSDVTIVDSTESFASIKENETDTPKLLDVGKYGTKLMNPIIVDDILNDLLFEEKSPCVEFVTDELDSNIISDYIKQNFPISEYRCVFKPDRDTDNMMYIKIYYKGLESPDKMEERIVEALKEREYFDIRTTYSSNNFREYISSFLGTGSKISHVIEKRIDERILSFRFFRPVNSPYELPTKDGILSKFAKYVGDKIPTAYYQNVPRKIEENFGGKIHGFSYMKTKKQPTDSNFVNILIFNGNKLC